MPNRKAKPERGRQRGKKPSHVYIPDGFDPVLCLPPLLQGEADSARYFLHRIIWGRVTKKANEAGFVNLKTDYLRDVIPKRVLRPLITSLIENSVIECDDHFIRDRKSYGYRLTDNYFRRAIVRYQISGQTTSEKIRKYRRVEYKRIRYDVHRHLRTQLRKLDVNLDEALEHLKEHREFEIVKIPVTQIANHDFMFKVCRFGRVHTDLTHCHSAVRQWLTVGGKHLVSIDLKNSQPLFLSLLLINYRRSGNKTFPFNCIQGSRSNPYTNVDELIRKTTVPISLSENKHTSPVVLSAITTDKMGNEFSQHPTSKDVMESPICPNPWWTHSDGLSDDESHFISLCEEGRLYEEWMEAADIPVRKWAKEALFHILYGKNGARSPAKKRFYELFPKVAQVIREHKRKDHRFLPQLLQKIESSFVINNVCRRLMNESPEAPIFTIHDSILTTPEHAEFVLTIFREEFATHGLAPQFHLTQYGKQDKTQSVM